MTDQPDRPDRRDDEPGPGRDDDGATRPLESSPPPPVPPPPGWEAPEPPPTPGHGSPPAEPPPYGPADPYASPPPQAPPPAPPYGQAPPPAPPYGQAPPPAPPYGQAPQPYGQPADPYGQQQPLPYGTPGYQSPYPGQHGYPAPVASPEQQSTRTQLIASLVINIVALLFCCGLASIGGAICAGIGLGKVDKDLPGAQRLARISWILLAANLVIAIVLVILFVALVANSGTSTY